MTSIKGDASRNIKDDVVDAGIEESIVEVTPTPLTPCNDVDSAVAPAERSGAAAAEEEEEEEGTEGNSI